MKPDVTPEAIKAVLDALVGSTSCNADTTLDDESMRNIPKLEAVFQWCWGRLCSASGSLDSSYYSAWQVAQAVFNAAGDLAMALLDERDGVCPMCGRRERNE